MHISREEYSLLHVNLANRKFAKRSLCKKGHLVVTKAHSASFFPNKHTSLLWPWLTFFCLAIDLSDIYKTIMLKLLLFLQWKLMKHQSLVVLLYCLPYEKKYFTEDFYITSANSPFTENLRNLTHIIMFENLIQNFIKFYLSSILLVKLYL